MRIVTLGQRPDLVARLARLHFEEWGPLTGAPSLQSYRAFLESALESQGLPLVLVGMEGKRLVGSASLVAADLPPRPRLTPWLAQVYVVPRRRGGGGGSALVRAAARRAGLLGFRRCYLYTSGTLPRFYRRLGWNLCERLEYLGKERAVMRLDLGQNGDDR